MYGIYGGKKLQVCNNTMSPQHHLHELSKNENNKCNKEVYFDTLGNSMFCSIHHTVIVYPKLRSANDSKYCKK